MSMLDCNLSTKKSSVKAASAYYLALKITNNLNKFEKCMDEIAEICGTNPSMIKTTAKEICKLYEEIIANKKLTQSLNEKFMKENYSRASQIISDFVKSK